MLSRAPCRFTKGRVQSQTCISSSSQRGIVYCAQDSHLHYAGDRILSSLAQLLLRRLDQTEHLFSLAGDANRPCQEQVRACRRKCPAASATHYPTATGETTCLSQNGSDAPGTTSKHGSNLEASAVHCPT